MADNTQDIWSRNAGNWPLIGSPLRPESEDQEYYRRATTFWRNGTRPPRIMVLGATPEFFHMSWPAGTDIIAVDHTQSMIDGLWPGPPGSALCAEWQDMPVPDASRDIVLCDGGINMVPYPLEQASVVRSAARVLAPGGLFVTRLYTPPERQESPESIIDDLIAGRISNLNVFKVRIWPALQKTANEGIELNTIWEFVHGFVPDMAELAPRIGWSVDHAKVFDSYRGKETRYYLPTPAQVIELFCTVPGGFILEDTYTPSYELGERCPFLVLRRADA